MLRRSKDLTGDIHGEATTEKEPKEPNSNSRIPEPKPEYTYRGRVTILVSPLLFLNLSYTK